ncbi:MAG: hypothetical protein ACLUAR_03280 [Pilosibacter sp.]
MLGKAGYEREIRWRGDRLSSTIQNLIEDKLAEPVLEGKVREGDSVEDHLQGRRTEISSKDIQQTAGKTSASVVKS